MKILLKGLALLAVLGISCAIGEKISEANTPEKTLVFQHHFIQQNLEKDAWGQTNLADIDRDGDLDFVAGRRAGVVVWFEYTGDPDNWVRRQIADKSPSDVGGEVLDIDGDGWPDMVAGGAWFKNPGAELKNGNFWQSFVFDPELKHVHDLIAADLDSDGKPEIITMGGEMTGETRNSETKDLRFYKIGNDPSLPWTKTRIWNSVHSGLKAGDIDGDGDVDLVRSDIWLENLDGRGTEWVEHRIVGIDWDVASQAVLGDINGDGRDDLVLAEGEIKGARVAWFECPKNPRTAIEWVGQIIAQGDTLNRGPYHSLAVADFDLDGDKDIFAGEMEWLGESPFRWFIWENLSNGEFEERVILDKGLGTHEAVVGDVDGDGDMDIAGKLWRPVEVNSNNGNNHADYLENLVRNN